MSQVTTQPKPLQLPPDYNPQPGPVESAGRWVPILGWLVASTLESQRMWPANKSIRDQLEAREPVPSEVWGDDLKVQAFARWLTQEIEEQLDRAADRFIPEDPLDIVFFDDDLIFLEIMMDARDDFGFSAAWKDEVYNVMEREQFLTKTLGEFIEYLVSTHEFGQVEIPSSMSD